MTTERKPCLHGMAAAPTGDRCQPAKHSTAMPAGICNPAPELRSLPQRRPLGQGCGPEGTETNPCPMSILKALAKPSIRTIWLGQVLAATGGEFYTVAIIWTAVDLIGSDAGYLSALQSASYLFGSLFAGIVTDRWMHGRTMVAADLVRAILVLILPIVHAFGALHFWLLLLVAMSASVVGSSFDPALQASVPVLAPEPALRRGTNGLFDATRRLARILGPSMIAALNGAMPVIQFFTVTAGAFLASAGAVFVVTKQLDLPAPPTRGRGLAGIADSLTAGFRALRGHPVVIYGFIGSAITNGCWGAGVILGLALLMRETQAEPLTAYGLVISAYGVGNVLANLVVAAFAQHRPAWRLTFGRVVFGVGVMGMAVAPDLHTLMLVAALAAINGPLCDLALLDLMQSSFPLHVLAPVFRVQSAMAVGGILIAYLMTPTLFQHFPVRDVIFGSGAISAVSGMLGAGFFALRRTTARRTRIEACKNGLI
ncbi:MAG: transporter, family, macrolide efflux protein [Aliidongia sp.]|nr:transporter, family, macrolide efflux protein [Aliidongia sp.]